MCSHTPADAVAVESAQGACSVVQPLVSVIIPTHNRPAETRRAVLSALAQTERRIEILVIDDGSRDPEALQVALGDLRDTRLALTLLSPNRGANHARNHGVAISRAPYVAFLDSDDEWLPTKLECQLAQLSKANRPTVSFCRFKAITDAAGRANEPAQPLRPPFGGERIDEYLFCRRGGIVTPSIVMRRELALAHPFDERLKRHQDFAFILKLASAGVKFEMLDEALVTVHWETLLATRRHINLEASREFLREYASYMSLAARACFWARCAVIPLLCDNRRRDALHAALSEPKIALCTLAWPRVAIMVFLGLIGINPLKLADLKRKVVRLISTCCSL
jgi:glycosyltransferase involved in cell wall biosynthesis